MARSNSLIFKFGAIAFCILAASCSREKKMTVTNPETGEKTNVVINGDGKDKEVHITSQKDGAELTIKTGAMPQGMPSFIKPYPNAKELHSMEANNASAHTGNSANNVFMVQFETNDSAEKVLEFYKPELLKAGYNSNATMNIGEMAMSSFGKEKENIQIMATKRDGKETQVQIIYSKS